VPANVGVSIEDYEILRAAINDEMAFVLGRIVLGNAEDAVGIGILGTGCADVFVPPGAPENFQN
jgi:hypothetical protein